MISKRFFCIVLAAALVFASCAKKDAQNNGEEERAPIPAASVPDAYYVTAFDEYSVFVRAEASTDSEALLSIGAGDKSVRLKDLKERETAGAYEWFKVQLPDGRVGWVREDVVVLEGRQAMPFQADAGDE